MPAPWCRCDLFESQERGKVEAGTKRNVYLEMIPLERARRVVMEAFGHLKVAGSREKESVAAVGRVLAEPVVARLSSPSFHASAMDGIAVKAADTFGARETRPVDLEVDRQAFFVNTGQVLPAGTDAVIMIEHIQQVDEKTVRIEAPVFPWQNVRKMGEDIVATELLFTRNHRITPYCVGALLAAGVFSVRVRPRPRVLIVPTGSELVDWRKDPQCRPGPGQVLESNSWMLGKLVEDLGGIFVRHDPVGDDVEKIRQVVSQAVGGDFDLVMTIGGSSAGSRDFTRPVVEALGKVLLHGVTMMPGKPVLVGQVKGKPVFGMPGYPVSAIIAFEQLVQPLLASMQHLSPPVRRTLEVFPTRKIPSRLGVEEFVRVKLGRVAEKVVATPLPRAAGCITSITEADGIIRIGHNSEGVEAGKAVVAELIRSRQAIERTLVVVGSHDNTLDVLADELRRCKSPLHLSSSHVGSMGGLMALRRGACHLAGSHLLDTETGRYNLPYIERFLAGKAVRVVHLVMRDQGLIVPPGNPKGISGIQDLVRPDVRFVNRQAGSGTRILLDWRLGQLGIDPEKIDGYTNEEYTHMAVAAAVISGAADAGLGILAAAKALGLDFIPVVTEQYDLVIDARFFDTVQIQTLLEVISGRSFRRRVEKLGGYDTAETGKIIL